MTLWLLRIEPYEMRYSDQFLGWFTHECRIYDIDYKVIGGEVRSGHGEVSTGQFLDAYATNYYKMTQMATVVKLMHQGDIKHGDKIFFFDLWHTGIMAIPYITAMTGQKIDIYGMMHAGTYDKTDYTNQMGMDSWARGFEYSIAAVAKRIFVGSNYHAEIIKELGGKVKMTGFPMYATDVDRATVKKPQVIFTGRMSTEKNLHAYKYIRDEVLRRFPKAHFVNTHKNRLTKDEYYELLEESKVVLSTQTKHCLLYTSPSPRD